MYPIVGILFFGLFIFCFRCRRYFWRRRRSGGSSLGLVARHTHVFQELGITRGQYTGLLPLLVRHGVAELFLMPDQDAAAAAATVGAAAAGDKEDTGRERRPSEDGGWSEVRFWFGVVEESGKKYRGGYRFICIASDTTNSVQ